jgi:hypothetical protein
VNVALAARLAGDGGEERGSPGDQAAVPEEPRALSESYAWILAFEALLERGQSCELVEVPARSVEPLAYEP